jgi:hypothetical protein
MKPQDFEVTIDVHVNNYLGGGGNISLRQTFTLPDCQFEDLAKILHTVHEATTTIRDAKKVRDDG